MKALLQKLAKRNILLSLTLLLLLPTYGESAAGSEPATIKIGVANCLTGPMASGGKWVKQGYEIGVKHVNESGGVYLKEFRKKIPLEIIMIDNESDAAKAATRMEKLYSVDKVNVFLGGFNSGLTVPQLSVAEKLQVPFIAPVMSSIAPFQKGYKYSFTPFYSEEDQALTLFRVLDSMPKSQRPTKLAYFEIQEEIGIGASKYAKQLSARGGYEIVTHEPYSPGANDFSSLIAKAKSAGAEVLYTIPTPPQGIRLIKQMKELNWCPKMIYMVRACDDASWPKNVGKDGEGVTHGAGWDRHLKISGIDKFEKDYRQAYGNYPEVPSGSAYTCIQILADALQRAGTLDPKRIRDAIATTNMMTVMGPMKFKSNGRGDGKYYDTMSQWQKGQDELVWPKDHASAPLIFPLTPWDKR